MSFNTNVAAPIAAGATHQGYHTVSNVAGGSFDDGRLNGRFRASSDGKADPAPGETWRLEAETPNGRPILPLDIFQVRFCTMAHNVIARME